MNSVEKPGQALQSRSAAYRAANLNPQPSSLNPRAVPGFTLLMFFVTVHAIANLVVIPLPTQAQTTNAFLPYKALYCFGFSWTDTQGLFPNGSPDPFNNNPKYWQNRASNGPMWPEFLSSNLGLAYVAANNSARAAAISTDTLAQVNNLPSRSDAERGLYVVWVAAGDFLNAADSVYGSAINWTDESAWNNMIQTTVKNSSNTVQRLYAKGARSVVIQNCLDLSLAPGVVADIGTNTNRLAKLKERTVRFNSDLAAALQNIQQTKPDLRLFLVDVFSRENQAYANPTGYGFTKVSTDALDDPTLADKSFGGPGKNYMFWDRLHGTSKLHELVAAWTLDSLTNTVLERLEASHSNALNLQMNRLQIGRAYTLQQSVGLAKWEDVTSFAASSGTNQWTATTVNPTQTFYRLKWLP